MVIASMATKSSVGISAETAGSQALSLGLVTISAAEPESAHLHEAHETALYVVSGTLVVYHGDWLQDFTVVRTGEFFFLPAGAVHACRTLDPATPCRVLAARSDPSQQEALQPLPELAPLLDAA